jgi:hypothetical protein
MPVEQNTVVDFVARTDDPQKWRMVLVEQGPWEGGSEDELRRIQDRLYGCLDAAIDGQLAEQFPETHGKIIVIQMDCYDVPKAKVKDFFDNFSEGVLSIQDYRDALSKSQFVSGMEFEVNFDQD